MASSSLGTLTLDLVARTGGFVKGMSKAERESKKWRRQVERDLKKLGSEFVKFAKIGAAAGVAAAGAFTLLAKQGLEYVDAQAKMARQVGASIDGLRGLQIAANDAGIETNTLNGAVDRLNVRLGEARQGSGQAYEALTRLGLSADALAKMDADQRIATIADRVKELGLDSADTANLLRELGIRNREMVNLIMAGGDGIRAARQEVDDYGLSLSEVDARAVEQANDQMGRIPRLLEPIRSQIAINLAEPLTDVADLLNDAARETGGFGEIVTKVMEDAFTSVALLLEGVDSLRVGLMQIQRIQLLSEAAGSSIRALVTREGETPEQQALAAHDAEIERIKSGDTYASRIAEQARQLGDGGLTESNERRARLQAGVDAGLGMEGGVSSEAIAGAEGVAEVFKRVEEAGESLAAALDKFNPSMSEEVEDILSRAGEGAIIDAKGVLRDAWGNALPTLQRELDAELKQQLNDFKSAHNLRSGLEAAAQTFTEEAIAAAKGAFSGAGGSGEGDKGGAAKVEAAKTGWQSIKPQSADSFPVGGVMPTGEQAESGGSGWSSITPRSADDMESAGSVIGWSSGSSKKETEVAASGMLTVVSKIAEMVSEMNPLVHSINNNVATLADSVGRGGAGRTAEVTLNVVGEGGSQSATGLISETVLSMLERAAAGAR